VIRIPALKFEIGSYGNFISSLRLLILSLFAYDDGSKLEAIHGKNRTDICGLFAASGSYMGEIQASVTAGGSAIFRPSVSSGPVLFASGDVPGSRFSNGSDPSLHVAFSRKANRRDGTSATRHGVAILGGNGDPGITVRGWSRTPSGRAIMATYAGPLMQQTESKAALILNLGLKAVHLIRSGAGIGFCVRGFCRCIRQFALGIGQIELGTGTLSRSLTVLCEMGRSTWIPLRSAALSPGLTSVKHGPSLRQINGGKGSVILLLNSLKLLCQDLSRILTSYSPFGGTYEPNHQNSAVNYIVELIRCRVDDLLLDDSMILKTNTFNHHNF
jgi:hypothetical protein